MYIDLQAIYIINRLVKDAQYMKSFKVESMRFEIEKEMSALG